MAFNLSNLLQAGYNQLGQSSAYQTTGGSATTSVVGKLATIDSLKKGVLFVVRDGGGAGAAPEGEFAEITAYAKATGTFTHDTITAVASGDTISIANNLFPLRTMIELANDGLRSLGDIVTVDTTTLDTASNKTEYALAVAWKRKLLRLDIQTKTDDANKNLWETIYVKDVVPAAPGSAGTFEIDQLPSDRGLRAWYLDPHPRLSVYSDVVDEVINPDLAMWAFVVKALEWRFRRGHDEDVGQDLIDARNEFQRAKADWPIERERESPKLFEIPREDTIRVVDDVSKVSL